MDSSQDTADRPLRIWLDQARQLLDAQVARRPPGAVGGTKPGLQMDLATSVPAAAQDAARPGPAMDLAASDPATVQRVKKAVALRQRITGVPPPEEATATELLPFDQARQAALTALDATPLSEAAITAAAQEFLRLQTAARSVATAVQQRLQALVDSTAAPLLHPSMQAPAEAEGSEWAGVDQAIALASATRKDLLASAALRGADLQPLQAQVDAALQARDLAQQAIQQRLLRRAADALLAKVAPVALTRKPDTNDGEWQPVLALAADVEAALNKPVLSPDDLRKAETRLLDLPATLRSVNEQVRKRLAAQADDARIEANKARLEITKQQKGRLATADSAEQKLIADYLRRLDLLTPEGAMSGSQIAQARQAAAEHLAFGANVLALIKARELLRGERDTVHGEVRSELDKQFGAEAAQQAWDKARADAVASPGADHHAATLEAAARKAATALKDLELKLLKETLRKRAQAVGTEINSALLARSKELGGTQDEPARVSYTNTLKADPEMVLLSGRIRNLADTLAAPADYEPALKTLPALAASAKRRAQVLQAEQRLSTALAGIASASGKSVDERMNLLRTLRADLDRLRADVNGVQAQACTLPSGERLLLDLDALDAAADSARADTLEDDCSAWRKKLVSLRSSYDAEITALRVARATAAAGAAYLKGKSKLYRSGGTPPSRGAVEAAIGAAGDPGYTLAAWAYTWDVLLAAIRDDLKDGYLTQTQLESLSGGTAGQRYVKAGNKHVSISFTKEGDLYRVTQIHVTGEGTTHKYFYNVAAGVITVQASTTQLPNPTTGTPPSFVTSADNLVQAHKGKFNCK